LASLLYPLTQNDHSVKDSFEVSHRILNIPKELYETGYRFVSFDVQSLFTNVPLSKTIDVIMRRIYKENLVPTGLKRHTLKKLIKDTCTKTPFSANGCLYQQIDGVSMGSSLGPVLANIILTELELSIVDKLSKDGVIKFYVRYVDDTLVLCKEQDFQYIQDRLNSFHKSLVFTREEFADNDSIHFLDISLANSSTGIYRKPTNTGQYSHFSSFEPWNRRVAWVRSLVSRAFKICSTQSAFSAELDKITELLSWNGYTKATAKRLLKNFMPKFGPANKSPEDKPIKIWMRLPFIGKRGEIIARKSIKKIEKLLNRPVMFVFLWQTTKLSFFVNTKDPTPKEYKSSVIYKFTCPGCSAEYVGKTDRCLKVRVKEHSTEMKHSEIFNHVSLCNEFNYLKTLMCMSDSLNDHPPPTLSDFILKNTTIIDQSHHWSDILFKEALCIRRLKPLLNHGLKASKELALFN